MEALESNTDYSHNHLIMYVASAPNITPFIINSLMENGSVWIKEQLASNIHVPLESFNAILDLFSSNPKANPISKGTLRELILRCPTGDRRQELIRLLSLRSNDRISRMTVAQYTDNPDLALTSCYDASEKVRKAAKKNANLPVAGRVVSALIGPASRR